MRIDISKMNEIFSSQFGTEKERFFFSKDIAISESVNFFEHLKERGFIDPFIADDYRFGLVINGELDITLNLVDYHVTAGMLLFLSRETIVQVRSVSHDFEMDGMIITEEMANNAFENHKPNLISGAVLNFCAQSTEEDRQFIRNIVHTMLCLLRRESYSKKALYSSVAALLYYYEWLYFNQVGIINADKENKRKRDVFNEFISLINKETIHNRTLLYYAERMDLTPRYISSQVNEYSGHKAKYWIDRATITHAKLLLRHTDKSILQISKEMNFPNDSFFCRYFRRLTGTSPKEYRESNAE